MLFEKYNKLLKIHPRKSKKIKTSLLQWIKHRKKSTSVSARTQPSLNRAIYVFLSSVHAITYVETEKRHTHTHTDKQAQKERRKERLVSQVAHARALLRFSSLLFRSWSKFSAHSAHVSMRGSAFFSVCPSPGEKK